MKRFFHRSRWDDERARELEAHLAIEIDENIARGMSPADARDAARRKLGNTTLIREEIYRMNTIGFLETILQDLRYAVRLLRLNPAFAAVAVLSLALGVGANAAIFELLDAVRMRTLPVAHPEQLAEVRIPSIDGDNDSRTGWFSGRHNMLTNALWQSIRDRQEGFSSLFAWSAQNFELSAGGESRQAEGLWVSGGYFSTLGVQAALGRTLTDADDPRTCASPPAVISYGFWQREFGASPQALGRTLSLDAHPYEIVGVMPADFFGVEVGHAFDVAVPLCAERLSRGTYSALDTKDGWFLGVAGRLKPGWSVERASAQLRSISPALFHDTLPTYRPEDTKNYLAFTLAAYPASTGISNLRKEYEDPLVLLLATTALVLLIACANLANLMLARATAREREIAVRLALGASRLRIGRQLLVESALLAVMGAGAGAWLAQWLSRLLVASLSSEGDRVFVQLTHDWRVFSFIALLAAGACVMFGLVPAIRATATEPGAAMRAGSRGSSDTRERYGLRRALVVAQVALSLVLVVGATLFVRTFRNLEAVDAGFTRDNLVIARLDFSHAGIADDRLRLSTEEILAEIRRQPGVRDAAQVRNVPIGGSFSNREIIVDGVKRKEPVNFNAVSDRYFATMESRLIAGRDFDTRDDRNAPRVAIVTESFARVFYGGANPIGRSFQIDERPGAPRPMYEIVGLTRDSKYTDLRDPFDPLMYVPAAQDSMSPAFPKFVVRSALPPASLTAPITALARALNPSSIVKFNTMETQVKDSLIRERLMAALSGFFGGLAALIAMIGLYGVMSYTVARRKNEIGIRMALGADRGEVVRMVMCDAARLLAIGLAIGAVVALAAARSARSLLFGLKPHDPVTLVAAAVSLAAVATLASYIPARRAATLEPTEALRQE